MLDTCVVIDALQALLPPKIQKLLSVPGLVRLLSSVSITEVVIKTAIGKLNVPEPVLDQVIQDLQLTLLAYTAGHARRVYRLPSIHGDPFDRMLLAAALSENVPIISCDRTFARYASAGIQVISY